MAEEDSSKNKSNMLSGVKPWDMVAEGYVDTSIKFFRGFADEALKLIKLNPQDSVLDVACGPGTLSLQAASQVRSVDAIDFSESMLEFFRDSIQKNAISNISIHCGDGQQLPYEDASFDAAFSMFGLMFFPDRSKGYSEIFRTLKSGGRVAISSWAPVDQSPLMQTMFGAMHAILPDLPEPQTDNESLENPDVLRQELTQAGFRDVDVHRVRQEMVFDSMRAFWSDMVRGSAPVVMLKNSMSSSDWAEKDKIAIAHLEKTISQVPATFSSDAWIGCGHK